MTPRVSTARLAGAVVLSLAALLGAAAARAEPVSYGDELALRARSMRLADERYWRLLLHYRDFPLRGEKSEADGRGFFLAPDGHRDPAAELEATLAAFFEPPYPNEVPGDTGPQHPQCRFPERYRWLAERLGFDPVRLPVQRCARLEEWRGTLDVGSVTLLFAAAYLNNPASMFGHTFLRLDRRGAGGSDLLSYIVNFAANVDTDVGVLFATRGLAGGFDGTFSTVPYYMKVQEYSNLESRDLWEYPLALAPDQVDRLVLHLWELGTTSFDYYFFDENCSYHLLSLIEVADPQLHLRERFDVWAIPADTLRVVLEQPGLVAGRHFRPSLYRRTLARRATLADDERALAEQLAEDEDPARYEPLARLPAPRQALVLDAARDLLQLRATDTDEPERRQRIERDVLRVRGRLAVRSEAVPVPEPPPPESGHGSAQALAGGGAGEDGPFVLLGIRPALHDFLAPPDGYEPASVLEIGSVVLRYATADEALTIERLDPLRLVSLWPVDPWAVKLSWLAEVGATAPRELDRCDGLSCTVARGRAAAGLAYETRWVGTETAYAFVGAEAAAGGVFDDDHRIGPLVTGGLVLGLPPLGRTHLEVSWLPPLLGDDTDRFTASLEHAVLLGGDLDVVVGGTLGSIGPEASAALRFYF